MCDKTKNLSSFMSLQSRRKYFVLWNYEGYEDLLFEHS